MRSAILIVLGCFVGGGAWGQSPTLATSLAPIARALVQENQKWQRNNPLIAVLNWQELPSGQRTPLAQNLESAFSEALAAQEVYPVVAFPQAEAIRLEWTSAFSMPVPPAQLRQDLAGLLGADWVVSASLEHKPAGIEMRLELYEVLTRQSLWQQTTLLAPELVQTLIKTSGESSVTTAKLNEAVSLVTISATPPETTATSSLSLALTPANSLAGTNLLQNQAASSTEVFASSALTLGQTLTGSVASSSALNLAQSASTLELAATAAVSASSATLAMTTTSTLANSLQSTETTLASSTMAVIKSAGAPREGMIWIEAGEITLVTSEGTPQKLASSGFWLDRTEVTNADYARCTTCERGHGGFDTTQPNQPVVYVDWENAQKFCLSQGKRLPTEAEWEYAARAGSASVYGIGDTPQGLDKIAWYESNTKNDGGARAVGTKAPNAWGLYDLQGNVMEWTAEPYQEATLAMTENAVNADYPQKVVKGGAWGGAFGRGSAAALRLSQRWGVAVWVRSFQLGFRCAAEEH